jgi:DNA mismatch repair protein MSH4
MSFADLATSENYSMYPNSIDALLMILAMPNISSTLALKQCRHPIRERSQRQKFVPNDIYATPQTRFQIMTGANMSGKSTYIRTVVLATIMMQMGSFVPASFASFPIISQIFARTSIDDSLEANASTFALEMREMAFILRNIDSQSMVIVDELGRGTAPRDGLAIALAISEALIQSRALVWFATHFKDLVKILSNRPGVLPLHMSVLTNSRDNAMTMLYQVAEGAVPNNHYGIAFARHFPLPPKVIEVAENVARVFDEKVRQNKSKSRALVLLKKRKLILGLREQLKQALESKLNDEPLRLWLGQLQKEFLIRMGALEEEVEEEEASS